MSEQEREERSGQLEEDEVEGHIVRWKRGEAEPPSTPGERSEESDEGEVEGHVFRWKRGEAEPQTTPGERQAEQSDAEPPEDAGEREGLRLKP